MDGVFMGVYIKKVFPKTNNYLIEGLRIMLVNTAILLTVGGISLGIFWLTYQVRLFGFPLPLPVWLILLGTGIPCFIFWFQYGKAFGLHVSERLFIKGLALGMLGNVPGFIVMYIAINGRCIPINSEIYRIILTIYLMFLFVTPIMVVLGTLDTKNKGRP